MAQEVAAIGVKLETDGLAQGVRTLEQLAAVGPKVERSVNGIERAAGKSVKQLKNLGDGANGAAGELGKLKKNAEDAERATIGVGDAMGALRAAVLGAGLVGLSREYLSLADAATNVQSRLKLVTDSTRELVAAQASLFKTAQDARVSYTGLVDTYAQMARSTKELGISQREMMGVTETISKAVTISGASAASAQAALIQLSQGFASGTLRGEELNSVMEQTPRLAMAIANGMGVGIGKLREMGQAGELTAEKVVKALQNSAGDVAAEFEQMAVTVEQATTTAGNSLVRLIGVFDQVTGASGAAAAGIGRFAAGFDTLADSIRGMAESNSLADFFTSAFQSNANLNAELKISEAEMTKLTARLAKAPDNIYVRSQIAELQKYIAGLKEAQARLAALTGASVSGGATDPRDQSQFISRGASYANYAKQQEAARQGLLEISAKSNGVTKQFTGDLKAYEEALRTGVISTNDYVKAVTELNKKRYESTEAGKAEAKAAEGAAKGNKEGASAILSYIKSLEARTAAQRLEIAQGGKLTESQRARIQLEGILSDAKSKASKSQIAHAQGLLAEAEANEAWLKNASEVEKALADMQKAREQSLRSVQDSVKKLVEEAEATAYAEMHNISLAEAVERLALARAENAYQQAVERQESQQTLDYLRQEIEARKELVAATAQKGVKEANKKAAEQAAKDWERVSQTIGDTLADYIMSGGKDAATYLKRLFSTLVLQPVVQTVVSGVLGTGAAAASGVSSGGVGGIANLAQQAYSAFTSPMFSNFGMGLASNIQQFGGTLFTKGFETLGTSVVDFGNTVAQFSDAINVAGDVLGYGKAIYDLTQGKYGSAVGTAIGTAVGGPVGAMIGSTLGGLVDDMFGSNPHDHRGGVYSNATSDRNAVLKGLGLTSGPERSDFTSRGNQAVSTTLGTTIDQLLGAYDTLAERATGAARDLSVYAGFATNPKDKDQNAYGYLRIFDAATQELLYKAAHRNSSDALGNDPAQAFNAFTGEIAGVLVQQLKAADLPGWMRGIFDGMGETVTLESFSAAMQQIQAIDYQFDALGRTMTVFAGLSDDMKTALLGGMGGMEALTAAASSYYGTYYSEAERMQTLREQVNARLEELGVSLGNSLDAFDGEAAITAFRQHLEEARATGQGELVAAMLAMNQEFAAAARYAQKAADDIAAATQQMSQAALEARLQIAQNAWDAGLGNLQGAVSRERTYWEKVQSASQEAINSLSGTLNLLTSNAKALYGEVDAAKQMQAAAGMVYIENALASVQGGAKVGSLSGLEDAISAARAGISGGNYASQFDRDRDALVLAGQLTQLGELADMQLSVEERALKAAQSQVDKLDQTLRYWQDALSLGGLQIDATMTVAQAVMALGPLLENLKNATAASFTPQIQAVTPRSEDEKAALYRQMLSAGLTDAQIRDQVNKTTGLQTDTDWDYLKKLAGIPGYANGGLHAGGLRLVGERGPELEVTGPARYWDANKTRQMLQGGGADVAAEVRALRDEARKERQERRALQEAMVRQQAEMNRLLRQWDARGMPEERVL